MHVVHCVSWPLAIALPCFTSAGGGHSCSASNSSSVQALGAQADNVSSPDQRTTVHGRVYALTAGQLDSSQ